MPSSTMEDYLKQLYLEQQALPEQLVPMGRLAAAMGVAPGTVTSMVKTLADSGLVDYEPRGGAQLTAGGEQLALHVLRRHRLVELFLVKVLGLDWSEVHVEAEALEHVISEKVLERIDALLERPSTDPHGDPIPSASGTVAAALRQSLADCPLGVEVHIARVVDQAAGFLQFVERSGLMPGAVVMVTAREEAADAVLVRLGEGREVTLGQSAAAKLLVEPA
jgi:DtxR family Mn-dependent transcriptional regulator